MTENILNKNFVGQLQEMCTKFRLNQPEYCEDSSVNMTVKQFRCSCRIGKWSSIGVGYNKKSAKQKAAEEMIQVIKNEDLEDVKCKSVDDKKAISKLSIYCMKEKLEPPLYSEKTKENNMFVIECTVNGFSGSGTGQNKKIAKEAAADSVATHFKVHEYYNALKKTNARLESLKNPISCLHELCQARKLQTSFTEKKILSNKVDMYVVTCEVGNKKTESSENSSKKNAKMEAAQLMLNILNVQPPEASLATPPLSEGGDASDEDKQTNPTFHSKKRHESKDSSEGHSEAKVPEESNNLSDDEPLAKRVNMS